jgi:hypothetical protein
MFTAVSRITGDVEVRQEIEAYVAAVNSYPAQFANDPSLSFQQYLFMVVASQGCLQPRGVSADPGTNAA